MHLQRAVFTLLCARCDWDLPVCFHCVLRALWLGNIVPKHVCQECSPRFPNSAWQSVPSESNGPWLQNVLTVSFPRVSVKRVLTGSFPRASLKIASVFTTYVLSPFAVGFAGLIKLIFSRRHQTFGNMMNKVWKMFVFLSRFVPMTVKSTSPGLHAISVALNCLHCAMLLLNWSYYSFRLSILYTVNMMFFLFAWEQLQKPKHMFKEFSTRLSKVCKCWISWMKGSFWKNYTPTLHAHSTLSKNECYNTILPHVWQKHSAFQQHLFL